MVVMVIGAIISGFNKGVSDSLARMGPTTFWVGRFWQAGIQVSDGSDEMSPWRRNPPLAVEDAKAIERIPSVAFVSVDEGSNSDVSYGNKRQTSVRIDGRSAAWPNVSGGDVSPGRSFTDLEDQSSAMVAVINTKLSELLFDRQDPIGQRVHIQGVPYTVIGVFNPPPQLFGGEPAPEAVIPHEAFAKYVQHWKGWMAFWAGPNRGFRTARGRKAWTEPFATNGEFSPGTATNSPAVCTARSLA